MDVEQTVFEEEMSKAISQGQLEDEEKELELENKKPDQGELSEMAVEKTDLLSEPLHVDPVVTPANGIIDQRRKYVSQFELVLHGRGILLCETY